MEQTKEKNFHLYFETYKPILQRCIYRFTKNKEEVDEVIQETFIKLLLNMDLIESSKILDWLIVVSSNIAKNHLKCQKRERLVEDVELGLERNILLGNDIENHEDILESRDFCKNVLDYLYGVNPKWYYIMIERYYLDRPMEVIAVDLGITVNNLYVMFCRARACLREKYLGEIRS